MKIKNRTFHERALFQRQRHRAGSVSIKRSLVFVDPSDKNKRYSKNKNMKIFQFLAASALAQEVSFRF